MAWCLKMILTRQPVIASVPIDDERGGQLLGELHCGQLQKRVVPRKKDSGTRAAGTSDRA